MSEVVKTRAVTALLYGQNARVDYESAVQKKQTKNKQKASPHRFAPDKKKYIYISESLPVAVSISFTTYSLPQPKQ